MPPKKEAPAKGLRLNLPGAPATWHFVMGVPGYYSTEVSTPVGAEGDLVSLERAKELDANPGVPLELVDMTAGEVERARAALEQHRKGVASALRRVVKDDGLAGELVDEEAARASGGK